MLTRLCKYRTFTPKGTTSGWIDVHEATYETWLYKIFKNDTWNHLCFLRHLYEVDYKWTLWDWDHTCKFTSTCRWHMWTAPCLQPTVYTLLAVKPDTFLYQQNSATRMCAHTHTYTNANSKRCYRQSIVARHCFEARSLSEYTTSACSPTSRLQFLGKEAGVGLLVLYKWYRELCLCFAV